MTSTISRSKIESRPARRTTRRTHRPEHRRPAIDRPRRIRVGAPACSKLGRYTDWQGHERELIARAGAGGSVLVVDRVAGTHEDCRLVAHIAADEPAQNAALTSRSYLAEARRRRCVCRSLTPEDLRTIPFSDDREEIAICPPALEEPSQLDAHGRSYRLERVSSGMSIPELRWTCVSAEDAPSVRRPVSVRGAVAALESYEPVRRLTRQALAVHTDDSCVSITTLRMEFARIQQSPIVLNRGLREATLAIAERDGLSMSEIAMRCGRVKRDAAGNESGETSWLARRLGLLPEGGRQTSTPWIHSEVLALIARDGLGLSPREVELG
jgi:hypothetical protein